MQAQQCTRTNKTPVANAAKHNLKSWSICANDPTGAVALGGERCERQQRQRNAGADGCSICRFQFGAVHVAQCPESFVPESIVDWYVVAYYVKHCAGAHGERRVHHRGRQDCEGHPISRRPLPWSKALLALRRAQVVELDVERALVAAEVTEDGRVVERPDDIAATSGSQGVTASKSRVPICWLT